MSLVEVKEYEEGLLETRFEQFDDKNLFNEIILNDQRLGKLASSIQFEPVTVENLMELRNLNAALFPMAYQDRYYKEVLAADALARIVYLNAKVVGTFSCRIQAYYEGQKPRLECYIMTFGVLAPFRRLKIGALMLQSIMVYYKKKLEIKRITLHVHTANEAARQFYLQHGFQSGQTIPNYYKRLEPTSAYLLCLNL